MLWAAAAAGMLHAAFSLYWAFGGRWLLPTVGAWAVALAGSGPIMVAAVLTGVALLKIAGSVVPVLVEAGRIRGRRRWRVLEWSGAAVLIVYGSLNVIVSWGVLSGLITVEDGYDRAAQLGHAALWDPLFLLWGLLLAGGLAMTRDAADGITGR